MQIKDNITAIINPSINAEEVKPQMPIKMAKLRAVSIDMVVKNSDKLMEPTWEVKKEEETKVETPTPVEETKEQQAPEPQVAPETPKVESSEPAPLPLTSEEVIRNKKDLLGIEAYKDIECNVVNLVDYKDARRLRVNEVVVGNANRERNINGDERVKEETKAAETTGNSTFDFSNLGGETPTYDNNTKLDEWLNKETTPSASSNDKELNEANALQAKLNDVKSSLATQKEILEALRARVANNETLVQAKKQEMEEENMNATRELSDILAEITRLKNKASEQETFLGISNEDESYGMGKVA